MKTNTISTFLVILTILSFSCKNDNNITTETNKIPEGLVFNDGGKWIANEETHIGMKRIDSIIKNNTVLDGKTLGEALSKETSYIIKNCDMKGDPHDQLHVVLVPILEEITEIKEITEPIVLKESMAHLEGLVNTYFIYFKT